MSSPDDGNISVKWINNFLKKETLAQVLSCEFCEIFKNTYLAEYLRTAASVGSRLHGTKYDIL